MQEYDAEFEVLGEPEVRRRLVAKQGLHSNRWAAAESWLALQEGNLKMIRYTVRHQVIHLSTPAPVPRKTPKHRRDKASRSFV